MGATPNRIMGQSSTNTSATMVVEVAGIAITTDSITTAIELALEASRRGVPDPPC